MSYHVVPLDDLQAAEPRAITDGPFGSHLARQHYTPAGPRVVRLQNIGDGIFNDASAHISEAHFETLRAHEVKPGDLLLASLGETLPRACLAPSDLGPAIVKADCIRVRLSPNVHPKWVLYSLQRPMARRWAEQRLHGTGRPRLGLKAIRRLPIPIAALDEQQRVVEILEDHLSRLNAATGALNTATQRGAALRRSQLTANFGLRDNNVALGDLLLRIEAGRSFGGSGSPAGVDEWGIIKVSAMTWGQFNAGENKRVPAELVDPRFEIRRGDLLVSRANTSAYVGASVLVGPTRGRLLLSDKSLRLVPRPYVSAEWLWCALQAPSARRQISALATGTKDSMRNVSQVALRSIRLPTPDDGAEAAVAAFQEVADLAARLSASTDAALLRSAALRRAVLAAAFAGRLTGSSTDTEIIEETADA